MPQPQQKEGLKAAAMTNIHIAANMIEQAIPVFGSETEEGKKLLKVLQILGPMQAKRDSSDLVPAEVLQMVRNLPQAGGGTEVQKRIMQIMSQAGKPQGAPTPGQPMPQGAPG